MRIGSSSRPLVIALLVATGLALPAFAEPPAAAPAPDSQAQAVKDSTRKVVDKASAWTQGALDWMARKGGELKTKADGWRGGAEQRLKRAVDDALAAPGPNIGVRVLEAEDAPDGSLRWSPLASHNRLPARVVVLVHGLDEPGNVWDDLSPLIRGSGHAVVRFDYPDDQAIAPSADALVIALKDLHTRGVERVDLVCHSMGGLVARDVLTRKNAYAGNAEKPAAGLPRAERLIMLGTPHGGAPLARLRYIGEAREHLVRWFESDGKDPRQLLGFLKDGAGEAGTDLLPESAFLTDLNSRPLPTGIKITNIIGTVANGEAESMKELLLSEWVAKVLPASEIDRLSGYLSAGASTLGDGIVSVNSARLKGVDDEVLVAATHRTIAKRPLGEKMIRESLGEPAKEPSAAHLILDRLGK